MPVQTHVRDILKAFAQENRLFYFLTNDGHLTGLISIVNFNCRQVKTYLFSLINEFEVRLGRLVYQKVGEEEILESVLDKGNHPGRR